MGDVDQVVRRDRCDAIAALLLGDHQAVGGQRRQRLAQRGETGAEGQPQRVEFQRFARLQPAGDDVLAKPVRDVDGKRLAEFLA